MSDLRRPSGEVRLGLEAAEGVAPAEAVDVPVAEASSISFRRRSNSRSNLILGRQFR